MGKYFGTDGFRGKANVTLKVDQAFKVGLYLGDYFSKDGKKDILVGQDTRLSSDMFVNAIASGIVAGGCNAIVSGVCPTPMVAYLVAKKGYACGAMISASHNPFYDNGIKLFNSHGEKCDPLLEESIESFLEDKCNVEYKSEDKIGQVFYKGELINEYKQWLVTNVNLHPLDLKIAIDCANGSSSVTAYDVLKPLVREIIAINNQPDGININTKCGSTHPEMLQETVVNNGCDLGFAFDGDADRLICVDEKGNQVNGDFMLYFLGKYLHSKNKLKDGCVVSTVMANLGFFNALQVAGLVSIKTDVGDKYVYEMMCKHGYQLGGEQSGHIIFKSDLTTGDGLLTALHVLEVIQDSGLSLSQLGQDVTIYPQELVNVKVEDKFAVLNDPQVKQWIAQVDEKLNGQGRLLVRASGTEPLVRVMAEAKTDEQCHELVMDLVNKIKDKYVI